MTSNSVKIKEPQTLFPKSLCYLDLNIIRRQQGAKLMNITNCQVTAMSNYQKYALLQNNHLRKTMNY